MFVLLILSSEITNNSMLRSTGLRNILMRMQGFRLKMLLFAKRDAVDQSDERTKPLRSPYPKGAFASLHSRKGVMNWSCALLYCWSLFLPYIKLLCAPCSFLCPKPLRMFANHNPTQIDSPIRLPKTTDRLRSQPKPKRSRSFCI